MLETSNVKEFSRSMLPVKNTLSSIYTALLTGHRIRAVNLSPLLSSNGLNVSCTFDALTHYLKPQINDIQHS